MANDYQILPHRLLSPGATINQAQSSDSKPITLDDKAEVVLTDFKHTRPLSITATATLDETNSKMIASGVRLLFVTEADGVLQGLITYTDVFGEKSIRYISEHGGSREEILAQDIMTPLARLEVLRYEDVVKASVGDIVETIKTAGRQHMLVIATLEDDTQLITGIFSSTRIEKLLDIKIELSARAHSFADLERALT